jgi:hypothetical protein
MMLYRPKREAFHETLIEGTKYNEEQDTGALVPGNIVKAPKSATEVPTT